MIRERRRQSNLRLAHLDERITDADRTADRNDDTIDFDVQNFRAGQDRTSLHYSQEDFRRNDGLGDPSYGGVRRSTYLTDEEYFGPRDRSRGPLPGLLVDCPYAVICLSTHCRMPPWR